MPYKAGKRLPSERASRLGHLEILKSPLVKELVQNFECSSYTFSSNPTVWQEIPSGGKILRIVFGVDGSVQSIVSDSPPFKKLAFVKTALLRIDHSSISKIDKESPHPYLLRDLLSDSALYHATVFPLKNVSISQKNTYHAVREIIFESLKKDLDGEVLKTLKWIAYEKWEDREKCLPFFECPHCEKNVATLPYDAEVGKCPDCGQDLFITDMLGFHLDMAPDMAPDSVAIAYMNIHETLLLFTGIRYFWETRRDILSNCLFVKDGPLSIRAQYSKLVAPIRRFLSYTRDNGTIVHVIGQEKSGNFFEHLELIERSAPVNCLFVPDNQYIKEEIHSRPNTGAPYGKDTNYGAKVFVKLDNLHKMVLNIPTGEFIENPTISDLLGVENIFATLPSILSNKYEGALLPIELANGIASLSTYPSAQILKIFAETKIA
ncbi:hypothetical protein [Thermodesulfovibrio yellowstonii]|uniref:NurA domain-containing protein n=1 Tax=Thermodesulfovibrio yellowstonii TaxID=28262 RepID=A0A9W6GIV4_9BACT|nr:hypothetical protein [Thermodesulfovibrio islandicus]GLI54477.1 hypothetical protein TISLANDTSLP1_21700 [Thermodesulfovibrio islandicus]